MERSAPWGVERVDPMMTREGLADRGAGLVLLLLLLVLLLPLLQLLLLLLLQLLLLLSSLFCCFTMALDKNAQAKHPVEPMHEVTGLPTFMK